MQPVSQTSVTFDETLDAIGDARRRRLLVDLVSHGRECAVNEVLKEAPNDGESGRQRYIDLLHVHLPKLEGYGLIRWDRDAGEVTRGPEFEEIRPLMELLHERRAELPDGWV